MEKNNIIYSNKRTILPLYYHTRQHTNVPLAKQGFNTTGCPLCGSIITLYDTERSEKLCADCGYVYDETYYDNQTNNDNSKPYTGTKLTKTEHKFFKKIHRKEHNFSSSSERNHDYYNDTIDIVKTDLCLTKTEVYEVKQIINNVNLKKLHSRVKADTIIVGVCRYVAKSHKKIDTLLRFKNSLYRDYNLTRKEYNIIEKNIEKEFK